MTIVLDELIAVIQERIGDRQKQATEELRGYAEEVALDLTQAIDNSLTERTLSNIAIDSTTGEFTLPPNIGNVTSVTDGSNEYEIVRTLREFQLRTEMGDFCPAVYISQDRNRWTGKILAGSASSSTVNVTYQVRLDDITIIPDIYREVVSLGIELRYHLRHSDKDTFFLFQSWYGKKKADLLRDISQNTSSPLRIKSTEEIESLRSMLATRGLSDGVDRG